MKENESKNIWDRNAEKFGKIGPKYWDIFGKRLVELTEIKKDLNILDIGTGRGASLFPLSEKVGNNGFVTGIDNSDVMVNLTNNDIKEKKITNAEVKLMDATKLKFKDNYFDMIFSGFGLAFIINTEVKLKEIIRVLKPKGSVCFSNWGEQKDQEFVIDIVKKYFPLDNSEAKKSKVTKTSNKNDLEKILMDNNFKDIIIIEEKNNFVFKNEKEYLEDMWTNAARGVFEYIKNEDMSKYKSLEKEILQALREKKQSDGIHFEMTVLYAYGKK